MIQRYTRKEMGEVWAPEKRFDHMLTVEKAVASAQAELNIIPASAANKINKKGRFNVERILEIEKTTKHDVIAFVSAVAENVGADGRYVHYGLTSSDVLDSALSLQIRAASEVLSKSIKRLIKAVEKQARAHATTLCAGRTHGMHAEPTSFGLKLAGHLKELQRSEDRVNRAIAQSQVVKLSGAVGTYSSLSQNVEKKVGRLLKLRPEEVATQVIPRDRHAEIITSLAFLGAAIERLSIELRHLQRTEVGEVYEGFSKGQKGSSAMPHKKNPISSENLTGVSRLLRSYMTAAMENIALWHERDISHSSVERVIFPDAFILADYACDRMATVIENLQVDEEKMIANMNASRGHLFSSHVLLELVKAGLSREKAYEIVQRNAHSLNGSGSLYDQLLKDKEVVERVKPAELKKIFSGDVHRKSISTLVRKHLGR